MSTTRTIGIAVGEQFTIGRTGRSAKALGGVIRLLGTLVPTSTSPRASTGGDYYKGAYVRANASMSVTSTLLFNGTDGSRR